MDAPEAETPSNRRFKKRLIFGAVFLLLMLLVAIAWWQRLRLADTLVRDQLESRGVEATYQIDAIGIRTQRLTNIVLGDPANPDLTAKAVEVDVALGFGTPQIRHIRAKGVRLFGRYQDGELSFGEVDKFRDPESKEPFALPDLNMQVRDAVLTLQTPWGGLGAAMEGDGNLRDRYDGRLVLRSSALEGEGCKAVDPRFEGAFRIRKSQPELDGPIAAAQLECAARGLALDAPLLNGTVKLSQDFGNWVGDFGFSARNAKYAGQRLAGPQGQIAFFGDKARTEFDLQLAKAAYAGASFAAAKLSGEAKGHVGFQAAGVKLSARGSAALSGGSIPVSLLAGVSGITKGTTATPVGPVMAGLEPALRAALRAFDGQMRYEFVSDPSYGTYLSVNGLALSTRSGARIVQNAGLNLSQGRMTGPVSLSLSGGGLPTAQLALRQQGSGWSGSLALAPYAYGGASIALPKLDFSGGIRQPWRFVGAATLSGPLMGGRIDGLSLPVEGSYSGNGFSMLGGCRTIQYKRFQTGSLDLPAQSFRACAQNGAILSVAGGETRLVFNAPQMAARGRLGNAPMAFQGTNVRFDLDSGFAASNVAVDLGAADSLSQFTMANLDGRFGKAGLDGTLAGAAGRIGNVPLLIEEASGKWSWNNDILTLDAMARLSDAEQVDRFRTLAVPAMQIALENGVITAIGQLAEPKTGTIISDVDIRHELNSSTGRALLAVDALTFGDLLQPSDFTPLTVGVVANVEGSVSGDGIIEWDAKGVRSRGKFGTQNLDFAAAFGPVQGLATELNFTDLLGMETSPSQVALIGVANPGIPAFDGKLQYRLLADQKVQVEGGRWPFYGGELILEPTILDFDVEAKRALTFRLVGLDAEKFFAGYNLDNISVSGVFDGTLPMVFDQEGGRIVGGWLVSRPGGGEVSYLGPLSYEDMGAMANFAFEALRSIRFNEMQIGVEGNLGGEVVTEVRFRGLQQGSGAKRNFITRQLAKLPIQFNVRIQSEFISLFGDLRSTYDGQYAVKRAKSENSLPIAIPGEGEGEPTP